jgi:hypothetical protein
MRVFNSIEAHGLAITRGAFRGGRDPWPYLPAFHCDLFLSAEPAAVRAALDQGTPAALVLAPPETVSDVDREVRIAFDGDAVLFDEESDQIFRREGQEAFFKFEAEHAEEPLSPGPFQPFLEGLARVQSRFPDENSPIRTALVTARNAPAHKRVVNTFRAWGIRVDEAYFLGGIDKTEILRRFQPHIFFDDSLAQLERAASEVPSAHVPGKADQLAMFVTGAQGADEKQQPPRVITKPKPRGSRTSESVPRAASAEPGRRDHAPPVEPQASDTEERRGGPSRATSESVSGRTSGDPEKTQ